MRVFLHIGLSCFLWLIIGCESKPAATTPIPSNGVVRVVSLAPSLTEIICAIGAADCLVGRSSADHYPPEVVTNVPIAGDFGVPSLEALAKCAPHVVITVDLEDANSSRAIEHLGIRHEAIPCQTLDDVPRAILKVGQLLHRELAAEKLAGELTAKLAVLRAQPRPSHTPRVFVEVWGDPFMTTGKNSFLTELIELAGGRNMAADVDRDFYEITPEAVLVRDPEVVIMLDAANAAEAGRMIAGRKGWAELTAVKTGRVCTDLDPDLIEVPGPRILKAVEILKQCILHEP